MNSTSVFNDSGRRALWRCWQGRDLVSHVGNYSSEQWHPVAPVAVISLVMTVAFSLASFNIMASTEVLGTWLSLFLL